MKRRASALIVTALALLYVAQGIPFGLATEYLPVVLREQHYSYGAIAMLGWLQLPWQLKLLWAKLGDLPSARRRSRTIIVVLQLGLAATIATFALRPFAEAPVLWFALTVLAAALAATQDVFVDAFAVRTLSERERGFGNTAQVAGYRTGMLIGGAALLLTAARLGERTALLTCAALVGAASLGAFLSTSGSEEEPLAKVVQPMSVKALLRHMIGREQWVVLALALTFKFGMHMAGALLKPMAVDYGWTRTQIGWAMVTVGSISALAGAAAGGVAHRTLGDRRSLWIAVLVQTAVCVPFIIVDRLHAPLGLTTAAIAAEHFGTGFGTTVLFAALMAATRPADAGLHYTILTSANALAISAGSLTSGIIADRAGKSTSFIIAVIVSAAPALLLGRWEAAAKASRG